jgi:hypothetical protein
MGIAYMPSWLVDDDLAGGRLLRLLPAFDSGPVTLFAVYTSRQYMSPKLRTFIDFLSERLGEAKAAAPGGAQARPRASAPGKRPAKPVRVTQPGLAGRAR